MPTFKTYVLRLHVAVPVLFQYSNECHKVLHYWYTAWPDHKAPDTARQLLDLVKEVETRRYTTSQQAKGPVIVHCR